MSLKKRLTNNVTNVAARMYWCFFHADQSGALRIYRLDLSRAPACPVVEAMWGPYNLDILAMQIGKIYI